MVELHKSTESNNFNLLLNPKAVCSKFGTMMSTLNIFIDNYSASIQYPISKSYIEVEFTNSKMDDCKNGSIFEKVKWVS